MKQEIHLHIGAHQRLQKPHFGQIFHAGFNSKARGIPVLIRKNMNFAIM